MHIIFENIVVGLYPIIKLLRFFEIDVFYLNIKAKNKLKKELFSEKLKKNNVIPLPIEKQEKIPSEMTIDITANICPCLQNSIMGELQVLFPAWDIHIHYYRNKYHLVSLEKHSRLTPKRVLP